MKDLNRRSQLLQPSACPLSRVPPPLPLPIPDWRSFQGIHSKSSQIGVTHAGTLIGVGDERIWFLVLPNTKYQVPTPTSLNFHRSSLACTLVLPECSRLLFPASIANKAILTKQVRGTVRFRTVIPQRLDALVSTRNRLSNTVPFTPVILTDYERRPAGEVRGSGRIARTFPFPCRISEFS